MSAGAASARALTIMLIVLATATTVVVATEFIVVGLLPVIAGDMHVPLATAGHLVSAFAISASLLGPPLTLVAAAQPVRRVVIVTLVLYAATNLAAVLWPTFTAMMAMRIIQGAALPVYIGAGTAAVSGLAPPERRSRSLALANTGFAIGVVIALPAGVALANNGVWAPSFVTLAMAALAAMVLVAARFPKRSNVTSRAERPVRLFQAAFLTHLALSIAVFATMFAAYTYLTAWLQQIAKLSPMGIAFALAVFGAAGVLGNMTAASIADRAPLRATLLATTVLAVSAVSLSLTEHDELRLLVFIAWGAAQTATVVLCQVRVTAAGGSAPAFAMALNISAANLGIAIGALAGGWVVSRWGVAAIGWGALGFLPLVAGLVAVLEIQRPQQSSCHREGRHEIVGTPPNRP